MESRRASTNSGDDIGEGILKYEKGCTNEHKGWGMSRTARSIGCVGWENGEWGMVEEQEGGWAYALIQQEMRGREKAELRA